jgi:hypothetical protein
MNGTFEIAAIHKKLTVGTGDLTHLLTALKDVTTEGHKTAQQT